MPMKCVLEHCEFANGGHCALVCPKRHELGQKRQADSDKIESCIAMLRRVIDRLGEKRTLGGKRDLPVGVYFSPASSVYIASISHQGKAVSLGSSKDLDKMITLRADAEKARAEGTLDEFVRKLKADQRRAKQAQRTQKGRRATS